MGFILFRIEYQSYYGFKKRIICFYGARIEKTALKKEIYISVRPKRKIMMQLGFKPGLSLNHIIKIISNNKNVKNLRR